MATKDTTPEGGSWTKYLPEAFGIRENIASSPFRYCVRESFMWGIATGAAMGLHRLRMKSHPVFATNIAFATTFLVAVPSYYFCYRTREHREKTIEMMMAANDFAPSEEMPKEVSLEEHPFMEEAAGSSKGEEGIKDSESLNKEYVAELKERKDWQKPIPMEEREASNVFKEVKKKK